jgi:hypothetical protein
MVKAPHFTANNKALAFDYLNLVSTGVNYLAYNQGMANFVIIPLPSSNEVLDKLLPEKFGNDSFNLKNGSWLVSFQGTSKQLADDIGITEGNPCEGVVLNFSGYWGRATPDLWEWINEHSKYQYPLLSAFAS